MQHQPSAMERDETLVQAYDAAFAYERDYGCCSQCVLAAVQDVLKVGGDDLIKASHTLAGGGAVTVSGTCGALAGALLAVGSRYGRERANFASGPHAESFRQGKRVIDAFVDEFGSPLCAEVQAKLMGRSFNLLDPTDFAAFEAAGGHTDKCTHVAGTAARIAAEVLLDWRKA
jgi:C_GCAxxG_C_C family probable redox protein